ncbi:GH92 family glycosyl hydrolase [Pontiella sulfatireligans]|uniref:Glycosyl hydrolase family 92 domain-containing protein n=1 Tax=Pontiella sulfatireligans TaxID=2750658 RepID=A0A6C2UWK4_9BACT|nr:GH92 family glycosyl hydrolase [Pontiella sulfatireligans]VGO23226.1 hypothetical protein SCARR_05333 [Pontiella sulfatireligans]
MNNKPVRILIAVSVFFALSGLLYAKEMVDYVDPMIGAVTLGANGEHCKYFGRTFPGAATPFGLVQLSPDTITGSGDHTSGYSYNHDVIEGFSFTHMSGVGWYGDLGNFQVMPTTGKRLFNRRYIVTKRIKGTDLFEDFPDAMENAASEYSHDQEHASIGYYSVDLLRYDIKTEVTAAPKAGIIRFTFPENKTSRLQIDLARRIGQTQRWHEHSTQNVEVLDDQTIQGYMKCSSEDGGWGHGKGDVNYTLHYYAKFSKPFKAFGVWDKDQVMEDKKNYTGTNTGFFAEYETAKDEQVMLKVGISFVSIEGAKANLRHDIAGWDFDGVRDKSKSLWSDAFKTIDFQGGSEKQKTILATSLYHCFIDPRVASDVDGWYVGADKKKHKANDFSYRTVFSGWDAFRSHFPFLTIVRPDIVNDEISSLLDMSKKSGNDYLPRWEMLNSYSGCMVGNPAVSVIVDAYEKGIRNYDIAEAYKQCKNSVDKFGNQEHGFTPGSMSKTLEYAYTDWCVGRFAESLGKDQDSKEYYQRSMAYKNIWDPGVKWMRTKNSNGKWRKWDGRTGFEQGTTESNPYQQGWFVPHDVAGFAELMGEDYFVQELKTFFNKSPDDFFWNSYYNHSNEPVHHVPYMFNYVGLPWQTQKWTREICENAYGLGPLGLRGNEDVGQMSAWYVLSAMGFHPVCPGDNVYLLTSPVFDKVTITLDPDYYKGGKFTVVAENNSPENIYIQSAKLNGKPLERAWITHQEIVAGGTIEYKMGPKPNKKWGSDPQNKPPSLSN